jgi:hypothetical protein
VQSSPNGDYVWVADRSERIARKTSVNTAVSTGPILQITRGLTIDSRVISSGFEKLQEGDRIRITGEDPENKNTSTPAMIDKKS